MDGEGCVGVRLRMQADHGFTAGLSRLRFLRGGLGLLLCAVLKQNLREEDMLYEHRDEL
jgi:hypothetical protein